SRAERLPFVAAYGMVTVTVLSLLLVSAQAVTAVTTERDRGTLDLLLATDLSPREFIFGKLGGIAFNVKEYVLPPLLLTGVYYWLGLLATPTQNHPELLGPWNRNALLGVAGALLVLLTF